MVVFVNPLMVLVVFMVAYAVGSAFRARHLLTAWMVQHDYAVLESKLAWLGGPLRLWNGSRQQYMFRVRIFDRPNHQERTGWVRVGGYWLGVLNPKAIEPFWDAAQ